MRGLWIFGGGAIVALTAWLFVTPPQNQIITLDDTGFLGAYVIPASGFDPLVYLIVTSGEMDNKGTEGIPHFVEHLAWLNSIGATEPAQDRHTNASTSHALTEYFMEAPDANTSVATLAKVLAPLPADTDFNLSERKVILREYDFRLGENPMAEILDGSDRVLYSNDPRRRSVLGSKAAIATFSLEEARAWHQATHRRENVIWVFYGPVTPADAKSYLWQAFPDLTARAAPSLLARDFVQGPPETILRPMSDTRFGQDFLNYRKTVSVALGVDYVDQIAQISLLSDILDSTLQGSFAKPLRFSTKTAQSYWFYLATLTARDVEFGFMDARPDLGVRLDQLQAAIEAAVQDVANDGIPADTFERVKARWLKRLETADALAHNHRSLDQPCGACPLNWTILAMQKPVIRFPFCPAFFLI